MDLAQESQLVPKNLIFGKSQIGSCKIFNLVLTCHNFGGLFLIGHLASGSILLVDNIFQIIILPIMKGCNLLHVDLWRFKLLRTVHMPYFGTFLQNLFDYFLHALCQPIGIL